MCVSSVCSVRGILNPQTWTRHTVRNEHVPLNLGSVGLINLPIQADRAMVHYTTVAPCLSTQKSMRQNHQEFLRAVDTDDRYTITDFCLEKASSLFFFTTTENRRAALSTRFTVCVIRTALQFKVMVLLSMSMHVSYLEIASCSLFVCVCVFLCMFAFAF